MTDYNLKRRNFLLALTGSVNCILNTESQPQKKTNRHIEITDTSQFFTQHFHKIPQVDFESWSLTVKSGDTEQVLTWNDIRHLPAVETMRTLACIGNPAGGAFIGNAAWKGVRLIDVLQQHPSGTKFAKVTALDGYETAIALDQFLHPDTLLVYEMNRKPLPLEHGYPVRLLVGGTYGSKMPKWVNQIEFIDYEFKGYWESRGWSNRAEVQTHTIIFSPKNHEKLNGTTLIQGVAFAGYREIVSVEVRVDGGEWIPASLMKGESPLTWTNWHLAWKPEMPGKYMLEARATDSAGFTQFEENGALNNKPDGASAIHKIVVEML